MTESEVKEIINGHNARNRELIKLLASEGVPLEEAESIEHHFWANNQQEAALLGQKLYGQGFLVLMIAPAVTSSPDNPLWNVEAGIDQSPLQAVNERTVENLTRLAGGVDAVYDGWGTMY